MKNKILKLIGSLVIGIILIQSNIVIAVDKESADLKNQQNSNNEKINEAKKELENIKAEKSETMKQVENLTSQIYSYETQIDELENRISELNIKIKESEENLDKATEEYEKQEALLEARLVVTYEAGETSYLDVLLSSSSITDLISNYFLVTELASNDAELLESIQKKKEEIENAKQILETSKKELTTSKASVQSISTQLKNSKSEKDKQVAKLSEDEKKTQANLDQFQADNAKIVQELKAAELRYQAQLEALRKQQEEERKQQQQNSNNNNSNTGNSSGGDYNAGTSGYLQRPVKTGIVSATMYYSGGTYHGALDYAIPVGTMVYAAADGVVLTTTYAGGSYGYYVVIQHTNGLRTYYAHGNGTFYVSPGTIVSKGQSIMLSGNSGNSSGPHLHFEVRVAPYSWSATGNDSRRDPRNYM